MGSESIRAVTHLDVGTPRIERALDAAAYAFGEVTR
jgi:hypothetical protein